MITHIGWGREKKLEIILVDDGSSDNSGKICDEFAQKDNRIKVIHKTNGGQGDARNKALDIMSGEWVSFVDSDDFVSKYYIENLYNLVKKYNVKMAITSSFSFSDDSEIKTNIYKKTAKIKIHSKNKCLKNIIRAKFYAPGPCSKIYKKELFDDIRFPKGKIYEDFAILPKIISNVEKIAFCNIKDYFYFQRDNSAMNNTVFKSSNLDIFYILDDLRVFFKEKKILLNALNYHEISIILRFLKTCDIDDRYLNIINSRINNIYNYFLFSIDIKFKIKFIKSKMIIKGLLNAK